MKTRILQLLLACMILQIVFIGNASGTSIHILTVNYWPGNRCPTPIYIYHNLIGSTTGYQPTDSVKIKVYFGDGADTTFMDILDTANSITASALHIYNSAGTYTAKYVVTGPDGNADSLIMVNFLTLMDTCGNISGKIYLDNNANCIFDAADSVLRGFPVYLYQNTNLITDTRTNQFGDYYFNQPTGNTYTITPSWNYAGYHVSCPSIGSSTINLSNTSLNNGFGISCNSGFDMTAFTYAMGYRPGYHGHISFDVYNLECQLTNGTAKLILPPLVTFVSSYFGPPPTQSGDTLIWNYTNSWNNYAYFNPAVSYGANDYWNGCYYHLDSSAVLGDTLCFTLIIDPINGDANPADNIINFCHVIDNSWDPNYKTVNPKGQGANGDISRDQRLTYNIHFQNVGNDTAYNVVIYDTLDANLDVPSFQLMHSDHVFRHEIISGNIIKFIFEKIMLPDSLINPITSQGEIMFSILPKASTPEGTFIYNKAGIVFDFNSVVITNTVHNRIAITSSVTEIKNNSSNISIFPNPASTTLTIRSQLRITNEELRITDVFGRIIYAQLLNHSTNTTIDISHLSQGIYFYEVAGQRGKIVKN